MSSICVIGDVNIDIVSLMREPLQINSDTQTSNSINLGGSPCNMSMWLSRVGSDVTFMAAIGTDLFGNWIKSQLASGGISTDYIQEVDNAPSGNCIILVGTDGQRTMLPDPGANLAFSLTEAEREVIRASSVIVMSAYSFLRPQTRQLALDVAQEIRNCPARLVIDAASSAPISEVGVDLVREYLNNADLVLANEDEFAVLDGDGWVTSMPNVVVKLGAQGSKWLNFGEEVCSTSAIGVTVVDTTGAGDSFLAGLVSVLCEHQDWFTLDTPERESALQRASEVAAMNIVSVGAGPT